MTKREIPRDADGNRVRVKVAAKGVAIGPLLRDAAQKDLLEGKGDVSLDVQSAGATVPALKKALGGSARVDLKDGAIKGINLAEGARNLKSAVGVKQAKSDPAQKTDFSEMSASFAIRSTSSGYSMPCARAAIANSLCSSR